MANSSNSSVTSLRIFGTPSSYLMLIVVCIDLIDNPLISLNLCYVCRSNLIIVHWILQDLDSGSSSDAQDIPLVPKLRKILSRERYCKKMFDENGQLIYPTNPNMPSSNNHPGSMVLHHELDIFYVDNPIGRNKNMTE